MARHNEIDFSEINSHLFVGSDICCQAHFARLLKLGVAADIDLEKERIDRPQAEIEFYLWLPVEDKTAPTQAQLDVGVAAIDNLIKNNKKVYVHCRNGHGRSPTLVAAYLIYKHGYDPKKAIGQIQAKRPSIHLEKEQLHALELHKARISKY